MYPHRNAILISEKLRQKSKCKVQCSVLVADSPLFNSLHLRHKTLSRGCHTYTGHCPSRSLRRHRRCAGRSADTTRYSEGTRLTYLSC
ncbi:unnamed protein product [Spodoptera exigua]|nr:unnamed protein product [Spodoptera exigua]